ncbi:chaplin [Streptomyces sp. URMC 127]|uniref:chaplin n=1 Tax=Streptomyces sp. URMC 127 TaxID=3423402 RepID=UPI003F1AED36
MNSAKKAALALAVTGLAVGSSAAVASAHDHGGRQVHEHRHHPGGAIASGVAKGSPGVISGNVIQVPIQIPLNICGNSIDLVGLLNPTFGNTCVIQSGWDEFHSHRESHHHGGHHGGHWGGGHDKHGHDGGHWGHDDHDDHDD